MGRTSKFSTSELRIIGVLYLNPKKSFRGKDLAKLSGCNEDWISRSLKKLTEQGLVVREKKPGDSWPVTRIEPKLLKVDFMALCEKKVGELKELYPNEHPTYFFARLAYVLSVLIGFDDLMGREA